MEKTLDIELSAVRPKVLALTQRFFRASKMQGDPEDVVQDVLLRLWTARHSGLDIRSVEGWAVTCTKNACISALRKERSGRISPLFETIPAQESASGRLETAEAESRLREILGRIPAGTRQLLRLRSAGMSLDEIAAATGRPKGSVKTAISAARKELMTKMSLK